MPILWVQGLPGHVLSHLGLWLEMGLELTNGEEDILGSLHGARPAYLCPTYLVGGGGHDSLLRPELVGGVPE